MNKHKVFAKVLNMFLLQTQMNFCKRYRQLMMNFQIQNIAT